MKRAFIFGGGVYGDEFPVMTSEDFIIAADAGCMFLKKHGIEPDITVGDFDSSDNVPEKNVIVLPVEKDITDSHAAVNIALERNCDEIYIYGGMGGRPDHTFANYSLIASLAQKDINAYLVGEKYGITAIKNRCISISGETGKTVSVFSWSEISKGVTLKGLKYSLENAVLTKDFALGVSNSFKDENAEISVKDGTLIIMMEN